ncbi:MAG: DUF5596 domain-containing protein [Firmicutes bacterium]|nr:DUF5596 domain-containing protein [Bacillota bacterium]
MTLQYAIELGKRIGVPPECDEAMTLAARQLKEHGAEQVLQEGLPVFEQNDYSMKAVEPFINRAAEMGGVHPYTVWGLFLQMAAEPAEKKFQQLGIDGQVFLDTFEDLKYKLIECKKTKGVWGNFVYVWYPIFYRIDIFKLGRLEYENHPYPGKEPYVWTDGTRTITIQPGDPVRSIHIPYSGEPFDTKSRIESYQLAQDFFKDAPTGAKLGDGPLICFCDSWLLYPPYQSAWPEGSNTKAFSDDFDIIESAESKEEITKPTWRIFFASADGPMEDLPENTRMERGLKQYYLSGGKNGDALGILIFDQGKILNA